MKLKLTLLLATIALIGLYVPVKSIAQSIMVTVSASIAPHYSVRADGNTLYIETNMKLVINGEEI